MNTGVFIYGFSGRSLPRRDDEPSSDDTAVNVAPYAFHRFSAAGCERKRRGSLRESDRKDPSGFFDADVEAVEWLDAIGTMIQFF
jgi:hypothetical protein